MCTNTTVEKPAHTISYLILFLYLRSVNQIKRRLTNKNMKRINVYDMEQFSDRFFKPEIVENRLQGIIDLNLF